MENTSDTLTTSMRRTIKQKLFRILSPVVILLLCCILSADELIKPWYKDMLPDGSIVWYKRHSKVIYPEQFTGNTREISFQGEALFEIAKDPSKPFIIHSGNFSTEVKGTSFRLITAPSHIKVDVLTGKVKISGTCDPEGIMVIANQQLTYYDQCRQNELPQYAIGVLSGEERTSIISDTEYDLSFEEDVPLNVVLRKLERKFDVTFILRNPAINNCPITMDLTDAPLEEVVSSISIALGDGFTDNTYEIRGNIIILDGVGCD